MIDPSASRSALKNVVVIDLPRDVSRLATVNAEV
jgi:hypothetical protein